MLPARDEDWSSLDSSAAGCCWQHRRLSLFDVADFFLSSPPALRAEKRLAQIVQSIEERFFLFGVLAGVTLGVCPNRDPSNRNSHEDGENSSEKHGCFLPKMRRQRLIITKSNRGIGFEDYAD